MKGLGAVPTPDQLLQAYNKFHGLIGEEDLVLMSQWARLDPRLAELLVAHVARHWMTYAPIRLHNELLRQPWPAALGPILEFSRALVAKTDRQLFSKWQECIMTSVPCAAGELFFIGTVRPGSSFALNQVTRCLKSYRKWGYLGSDVLFNKALAASGSWLPKAARKKILDEFLKDHQMLTVDDYLRLLDGKLTRRLAELDLQSHPKLRSLGFTRNRRYHNTSR